MLISILSWRLEPWQYVMAVLALTITVITALVVHECAHAWMAFKQGDGTAKAYGRLTLNPAKHLDPMGTICLLFAGFGWAKPVPVNPFNYRNFRRGNFLVSIAGVLSNFILAFLFSFLYFMMIQFGNPNNLGIFFLTYLGMFGLGINCALIIFNLLPIYPLDGYNMLVSVTKPQNKFMRFMREYGFYVLIAVVILPSALFGISIIEPLMDGLARMFLGLWGIFF